MVSWVGFRQTEVKYVRDPRAAGHSKYSWKKMLGLATDAIFSFSLKPVRFVTVLGVAMMIVGTTGGLLAAKWLAFAMVACTGLVLTALGVVGEYIMRIYDESRQRPIYIVASSEGFGVRGSAEELFQAVGPERPRSRQLFL